MKLYERWDVTLPGESYVWEPDEVTLGEQLMLERESGGSYDDWVKAVAQDRAEACQILVWFLRLKAGRQEDRFSVDFPIRKLQITEAKESEPDPEAPAASEAASSSSSPETESHLPNSTGSLAPTS